MGLQQKIGFFTHVQMTIQAFKEKYGYEIEGIWVPRVTAITSSTGRSHGVQGDKYSTAFAARIGLQQAAEWGTIIHETVEKLLQGEDHVVSAKIAISINEFQDWYKQRPFQLFDAKKNIERRVYDLRKGYAGTVDIIAEVQGKVSIIDLKTSTGIWKEHALQTAAYLNAYNESSGDEAAECETRWILRIDQYQECEGCYAKRREKYGRARTSGGNPLCNHQWSLTKGEIEFKELEHYDKDIEAFFAAKVKWEERNKEMLSQIPNYHKNIKQPVLL